MSEPQIEQDEAINLESWCFDELDRDTTPRTEADPTETASADLPQLGPQPRSIPPARELRPDCFPADLA